MKPVTISLPGDVASRLEQLAPPVPRHGAGRRDL